jgi:hypothetical protein
VEETEEDLSDKIPVADDHTSDLLEPFHDIGVVASLMMGIVGSPLIIRFPLAGVSHVRVRTVAFT